MKRFFIPIIIFTIILLPACKVGRFFVYNYADIKDYKKFQNRTLEAPDQSFQFAVAKKGRAIRNLNINGKDYPFDQYAEDNKTVAFLVIQNDTIQYEKYWKNYTKSSIVPSFSMAKSILSILIGIAIDEGKIKSVKEPITNYIPELKSQGFEKVNIEHLLQMTSGIEFKESYSNPFGEAATFYYGRNLRKAISKLEFEVEAGERHYYSSGDSQILGLILERALGEQTLTNYLQEKIWQPLGMEYDASWSIDRKKNGLEKTFCCVNARARDFAKIGRLYLNNGEWNGKQIVSKGWVETSTQIDTTNGSEWYYQYQWWLPTKTGDFMAQGILGQYIYVNPEKNLIIVRLGKKQGDANWWQILASLGRVY